MIPTTSLPTTRSSRAPKPTINPGLWQSYRRTADPACENELVKEYLPLVKTVVARLAMTMPAHVDIDDLNSAGLIGLLQAMRNYNPHCGTSFETYARVRIRGAILDELRRMDWVPRSIHDKARKIQNATNAHEQKTGKPPTEAQMAKALGLPLDEYQRWLKEIRPATFVCLDAVLHAENGEGSSVYESITDSSQEDPTDGASRRELIELVAERLQVLPEIQQKVLALYYFEDLRLREIAEVFGLTESRICQIHSQAILNIRSYLHRYESAVA